MLSKIIIKDIFGYEEIEIVEKAKAIYVYLDSNVLENVDILQSLAECPYFRSIEIMGWELCVIFDRLRRR